MTQDSIASTDILGVSISALDMPTTVNTIEAWVEAKQQQYVCCCTVHVIIEADKDPNYKALINRAGLRCPDGMPLVWLSHRSGKPEVQRVYAPDLMLELCARSHITGHRHFFYGGNAGVTERLIERLTLQFPGIKVAGWHTPGRLAIGELEHPDTIAAINASAADIVWVGLGCPKQEWWVANHCHLLNAPVLVTVGASFDFNSGAVKQAPLWMQNRGLEWAFRLTQDPRRLWKRYLFGNAYFTAQLFRQHFTNSPAPQAQRDQ